MDTKNVEVLIDKAARASMSEDAVRYSQAATNAAHALYSLKLIESYPVKPETPGQAKP